MLTGPKWSSRREHTEGMTSFWKDLAGLQRRSGILIEVKRIFSHDEINWAERAMSKLLVEWSMFIYIMKMSESDRSGFESNLSAKGT